MAIDLRKHLPPKKIEREYTFCLWKYYEAMYRPLTEDLTLLTIPITQSELNDLLDGKDIRNWYDDTGGEAIDKARQIIFESMVRYK